MYGIYRLDAGVFTYCTTHPKLNNRPQRFRALRPHLLRA